MTSYIVKAGKHYSYGYSNYDYAINAWPTYHLTDKIDNAKLTTSLNSAKSKATSLVNILTEWTKRDVDNDPTSYLPITIVEVSLIESPPLFTKNISFADIT